MTGTKRTDSVAIIVLILLWLLFFWRLFTPVQADQASLKLGDFSGQFVTFAGYQYQRFAEGQVPLWNPYNNGGLPFIADTQAAVFYPPRLVTIALSNLAGGWSYHALELEMTFHVLAFTLLMYAFVKRLTGSLLGAFCAAVIAGYGGYLSGYPPLQLALLEAGIWLPLAALGILEATRTPRIRWRWLVVTGIALGVSWLAGHPQTSFFLTYLLVAWWGYRLWMISVGAGLKPAPTLRRIGIFVIGTALFGLIAIGISAVQLLPGVEYLTRTTRAGFGYDAKANGFPLQDVAQFIVPGIVSLYSPLWIGITGLALALIALWRRISGAWFWGVVALLALLWSFGGNSVVYPAIYNILPGLRFFRGQERAAYLVVNGLAILAGMGAAWLTQWDTMRDHVAGMRLRLALNRAFYVALALGALVFVTWIGNPAGYGTAVGALALAVIVTGVLYLIISTALARGQGRLLWLIAALLVFELFTVNMDAEAIYDHTPPDQQVSMIAPPLLAPVIADANAPFRVDGFRGLTDNYGSLYDVMDIHGISPLWLAGPYTIIEGDVPDARSWELFAVRYVFSDWQELPVPTQIVSSGTDRYGDVNLHELSDPRPFALLDYQYVVADDESAYGLLRDPTFDARRTVILSNDPGIATSADAPAAATVMQFTPETIIIHADAAHDAILSLALPNYPGWYATIDGAATDLLRAYGALDAVVVPSGSHTIRLDYNPLSYRVGASLSLFTWLGVGILGIVLIVRRIVGAGLKPAPTSDGVED